MDRVRSLGVVVATILVAAPLAVANDAFTIVDAINQAVATHPGVGETAANRRATEAEMRQAQGYAASAGPLGGKGRPPPV